VAQDVGETFFSRRAGWVGRRRDAGVFSVAPFQRVSAQRDAATDDEQRVAGRLARSASQLFRTATVAT
jgi:hypothetical protein